MTSHSICVYCGSRNTVPAEFLEAGARFGKMMAEKNTRLVYGGGDCGIMGAVANSVLKAGGKVTGVFPYHLQDIEKEHTGLTEIILVDTMHERKQIMFERSDAFVVLPGGFGTMDETFEIITWRQLGLHTKPIIICNLKGYWDPWVKFTDHMLKMGFASPETAKYYKVVTTLEEVFPAIEAMNREAATHNGHKHNRFMQPEAGDVPPA